jgi:transcriptional regulator NrdR family protein
MECPNCKTEDGIIVTHTERALRSVRRRRQCLKCRAIFYTWEVLEKDLTLKRILRVVERLTSRLNSSLSTRAR